MNLNAIRISGGYNYVPRKIFLVMKITAFLMLISILTVSASTYAQRITLNEKKASLDQVLAKIRQQSGYDVIYSNDVLEKSRPVTVKLTNANLEDALKASLQNQPLTYEIDEKTVLIKMKDPTFLDNIKTAFAIIDVRGRVVDEKGQPLPGVTVKIKDESQVTTTDKDGSFILKRVDEKSVIVISFIGYLTKEINATSDLGTIQLEISNSKLDEVQIQAYGKTSLRLNTGNIVSIKSSEIQKQSINNPLYALQGKVPGLIVTPTTGLAGGAVNLQLRGNNSLNFLTEPLIVIDGLPIVNNVQGLGGSSLLQLSSLSFLNPNDIESIDVLKDADATSIYGSRGANGVILVTTKKGQIGQTKVDVNVQTGWGKVGKEMNMLNTPQYLAMRKEAFLNKAINIATLSPSASNADVTMWDQNKYTDWQKELIGGTAGYYDVQSSVSGGSSIVQYIIGGNYHKENTVFPGTNFDQKGSAHMSLTGASANQRFKANLNASYMADNNTLPGLDLTGVALQLPPNAPNLYTSDGELNWEPLPSGSKSWNNPLANLYHDYSAKITNLVSSGDVSYLIMPGLTAKTQLGFSQLSGNSFLKSYPFAGRPPEEQSIEYGIADFNENSTRSLSVEPQLIFNRTISHGLFNFLIGGSLQTMSQATQSIDATGATSDALLKNLAAATSYTLSNSSSQYKYSALYARIGYNWDNKYLLNINARRDGSSRFAPNNQFGNFGSVAAAWIFSAEPFLKNALPILSFGKIRMSYGTSGNDGIGDYAYLERYEPLSVDDPYQGARGYTTTGIVNSHYHWETTRKLEFGLETGFFQDRIFATAVYFRNRSDNQLQGYAYASIAGPGGPTLNIPALIQNSGIEFTLSTTNVRKQNFRWTSSINFTQNTNKLLGYPDQVNYDYFRTPVGQPFFGTVLLYKSAGVDPQTGKYLFQKQDGTVTSDPSDPTDLYGGKYVRISTLPKFYGGVSNNFIYKGFSLDVFFQFTKQMGLNPLDNYLGIAGALRNLPTDFLNHWKNPGDNAPLQKIFSNTIPSDYRLASGNLRSSDFDYVDASFIRLKNLSFSYSFKDKWVNKIGVNSLRLYLQGQNLLTITRYKGLDPETRSTSALPPLKLVSLGLQVSL